MSETLENVIIAEVETSRRNERPAQRECLFCSGGSHCHLPLWAAQELTLGWAGELPGLWKCQQEVSGQWEVQAEVWAPTPSGSLLPSLPHTITEPWLPPRLPPAPTSLGGQDEASPFQI